jgi:hypothetical protein
MLNASYLELEEGSVSNISSLTAFDCFNVNGLKTRQELFQINGIELSLIGYARLGTCLSHFISKMKHKNDNDGTKKTIFKEVGRLKKPGVKIRELLVKKRKKPFDLSKQTQTTTFSTITGSVIPSNDWYGSVISLWTKNSLSNRIRTFLFKFYNNLLGLNTRVSHFDNTVSRQCTLCKINQQSNFIHTVPVPVTVPGPVHDETFKHVFYDCPITKDLHIKFLNQYFTGLTFTTETDRINFFFQGRLNDGNKYNLFIHAAIIIFQYCIWEMKLKKRLLSFESVKIELMETINALFYLNKDARTSSQKYNFPLCRTVNRLPPLPQRNPPSPPPVGTARQALNPLPDIPRLLGPHLPPPPPPPPPPPR